MNCPYCQSPTVYNNTAPVSDDGFWCELCQIMNYIEEVNNALFVVWLGKPERNA